MSLNIKDLKDLEGLELFHSDDPTFTKAKVVVDMPPPKQLPKTDDPTFTKAKTVVDMTPPKQLLPKKAAAAQGTVAEESAEGSEDSDAEDSDSDDSEEEIKNKRNYFTLILIALVGVAILAIVAGVTVNRRSSTAEATAGTTPPPILPAPISPPTTMAPSMATIEPTLGPTASPITSTSAPSITVNSSGVMTMAPSNVPTTQLEDAVVSAVALAGGTEFEDPTSYQSLALAWLLASPSIVIMSEAKMRQRYALACIYFATNAVQHRYTDDPIVDWNQGDGWLTENEECLWFGLTCNPRGEINATYLQANNLTGTFPRETILLQSSLRSLNIANNEIWNFGEECDFLGELTELVYLDIGVTFFEYDGIPPAIGLLTNLEQLKMDYTLFYGGFNNVFENLQRLWYIEMGGNSYNEPVPSNLAQLPRLSHLYIEFCDLTGGIDFLSSMAIPFEVWMDFNRGLTGTIPNDLDTKVASLASLSVTECSLTGTLPTTLGRVFNMQQMWFYDNQLTGTIPWEIQNLRYMREFQTEENLLTGTMPAGICSLQPTLQDLSTDCAEVACTCCTCCAYPCP